MKQSIYKLIVLAISMICVSCSNNYYSPALYKNDISYQFKPMSSDSVKTANYITGTIAEGITYNQGGENPDNILVGKLALNRSNTYQNVNIAYGAYGFAGLYQNGVLRDSDPGYFDNKTFSGLGLRFSTDYYIQYKNADVRIIGIEASYSKEFGDYNNYRSAIKPSPYIYSDASTSLLTAGLTNETIWHSKHDPSSQFGYRVFIGGVLGNHQFINYVGVTNNINYQPYTQECFSIAGFTQIKKYQLVAEFSNVSTLRLV